MTRQRAAIACWSLAIGGLAFADLALAQGEADGDTLSECVRTIMPAAVFVGAWTTLTAWLVPHIVNGYPTR